MVVRELSARDLTERVDELLEASYRSADLGNLEDPLSETVYILLSQQTREAVYMRVFAKLRRTFPRWEDVLGASLNELEAILTPTGFQRRRARQLQSLLGAVREDNVERAVGPGTSPSADLTLDYLSRMTNAEAEQYLCSLPGVGPKTARCVLAYALGRQTFAVDTHVHRIFVRMGLLQSLGRKRDHDPFQAAVPSRLRKRLHINLVHHGRTVCRNRNERCDKCVLVSFCRRGREALARQTSRGPVAFDLFGGAGGLGSGFRREGYRIALAVETDRHAAQTYRYNNPGVPVIEATITRKTRASNLRRFTPGLKGPQILLAGPPCQGYSAAGSRRSRHPMNGLYRHVARLARQLRVQFVVVENVPGIRRVNGRGYLESIKRELTMAGFSVGAHLLRACWFGVPQHRIRYFFLGRRGKQRGAPPPPTPTHRPQREAVKDTRARGVTATLADQLRDLPAVGPGVEAERIVLEDGREALNLSTMRHSQRVIDKIARIKPGEGPISYRRLEPVEARTLIAGHRALPVHPELDRTVSVREAAVIQGFPLNYFFCGPRAWQPLQVANAVPPPVAAAVARAVRSCLLVR